MTSLHDFTSRLHFTTSLHDFTTPLHDFTSWTHDFNSGETQEMEGQDSRGRGSPTGPTARQGIGRQESIGASSNVKRGGGDEGAQISSIWNDPSQKEPMNNPKGEYLKLKLKDKKEMHKLLSFRRTMTKKARLHDFTSRLHFMTSRHHFMTSRPHDFSLRPHNFNSGET